MKITTLAEASCEDVSAEIQARAKGESGWIDPHNMGKYHDLVVKGTEIDVERDSGPASKVTYTDKIVFTLTTTQSKCLIECCSESQVTSYLDFGTNYCNLEMLFCGSSLGCKPVLHDFENIVS